MVWQHHPAPDFGLAILHRLKKVAFKFPSAFGGCHHRCVFEVCCGDEVETSMANGMGRGVERISPLAAKLEYFLPLPRGHLSVFVGHNGY